MSIMRVIFKGEILGGLRIYVVFARWYLFLVVASELISLIVVLHSLGFLLPAVYIHYAGC